MSKDQSVLVCGIGEAASATARRLFGEGYAVALHRATPPRDLRRRMCFADAWFDGGAQLDGIEARRADVACEFLVGLQTRNFIPLLRTRLWEVLERWPWDVIVATREDGEPSPISLRDLAGLTIGLGEGFAAGKDCDLVVETDCRDPGAILREGDPPQGRLPRASAAQCFEVLAPRPGLFRAAASIGALVDVGERLGAILDAEILSPVAGRIRGMARKEAAVGQGAPIVEIAAARNARVAGISEENRLVSRGVAFAVEMESEGWARLSFEKWF